VPFREQVGRTPRSADDALVGLLFVFRTPGPRGADADGGVRPTFAGQYL